MPTLLAGATFGRIAGHILNGAFPGKVADAGTYALIGAAAILGGKKRLRHHCCDPTIHLL